MNLRQLRYFVGAAEAGNMTRAAEQLRIAQPALGMQIRQLEQDLGVALLQRHSRGIELTEAGRLLLARAHDILGLVETTRHEVGRCGADATETIRLGLTSSLMHLVAPEILLLARDRAPRMVLNLVEDMSHLLADALGRGELDVALAYDLPPLPNVVRRGVYQEDLALVTLPGPQDGAPVTLAAALEEPLIMPEPRDTVRGLVARTAEELGLGLSIACEVRSIPGIKGMVLRGVGAAILPFGTVLAEVRDGRLSARPIVAPALRRTLFLAMAGPRGRFRNEVALAGIVQSALGALADAVGPYAHPLLAVDP